MKPIPTKNQVEMMFERSLNGLTADDLQISGKGKKFDSGKLDYTLLPWDGVEEVVKVLEFGAKKYDRDNWQFVENAETRYMAAAFRHLVAYQTQDEVDPETGLSHLAHAACCMLFLLALEKRNGSNA